MNKRTKTRIVLFYVIAFMFVFLIMLFAKVNHIYVVYGFTFLIGFDFVYLIINEKANLKTLGLGKTRTILKKEYNKKHLIMLLKNTISVIVIILLNLIIYGWDLDILVILILYFSVLLLNALIYILRQKKFMLKSI